MSFNTPCDRSRLREVNLGRRFNPKPRHIIVDLKWISDRIEMELEKSMGVAAQCVDNAMLANFIEGGLEQIFYGAAFTGEATLDGALTEYGIPRDVARQILDELDITVQRYFDQEFGGRDSANDYNFRLMSVTSVVLTESQPIPQFRKGFLLTESSHDQYISVPSL